MKRSTKSIIYSSLAYIALILLIVLIIMLICGAIMLICGASWIITCGIIKLITLCFGLPFSWSIATGIWLIICLISAIHLS